MQSFANEIHPARLVFLSNCSLFLIDSNAKSAPFAKKREGSPPLIETAWKENQRRLNVSSAEEAVADSGWSAPGQSLIRTRRAQIQLAMLIQSAHNMTPVGSSKAVSGSLEGVCPAITILQRGIMAPFRSWTCCECECNSAHNSRTAGRQSASDKSSLTPPAA